MFLGSVALTSLLARVTREAEGRGRHFRGLRAALAAPGEALHNRSTRSKLLLGTVATNLAGPLSLLAFFEAAGFEAPLGPVLLASSVMTVGAGLPVTFANLGTYELIFGSVYSTLTGRALAEIVPIAMASHAVILFTVVLFGGLGLVHLGLERPRGREHEHLSSAGL